MSLSEVQTVCCGYGRRAAGMATNTTGLQGILEEYLHEELDALTPEMRDAANALLRSNGDLGWHNAT